MKIYLVRHGETDWNKAHHLQGQTDVPLNEYGRELARLTSDGLKDIPFEIVYHSPLNRAEETAYILKRDRDIPVIADERIREISFGVEEGSDLSIVETTPEHPLYNFISNPGKYIPPKEAESFEAVYTRSRDFINKVIIPLEGKYETVLIVAHGALNRTILNEAAGIPLSDFWKIRLKNCSVSCLDLTDGVITVEEPSRLYYESKTDPNNILN